MVAARLHRNLLGNRHRPADARRSPPAGRRCSPSASFDPRARAGSCSTFVEAVIGLGLVSLMISYLPTIYGAFSRREALVGMLEVRAGLPPSTGRAADPVHPDRLAEIASTRNLRAVGDVVRRDRGEPHQPAVAGVLPLATPRAQLDHRRRLRARHRGDRGVDARPAAQRALRRHDPQRLLRAAPDRRLLQHPVRPRPDADDPISVTPARVRPAVRRAAAASMSR